MTALILIAATFAATCFVVPAMCWSLMTETRTRRFAPALAH